MLTRLAGYLHRVISNSAEWPWELMRQQIASSPFYKCMKHRIGVNDLGEEMTADGYDPSKYWIHEEIDWRGLYK